MMLRKKTHRFTPSVLAPGGIALLGTQVKYALDNTWPIEEMLIFVNVTCGATGPTLVGPDNVLGILKHINVGINDNNQPRSVVDCSGVALLEYCEKAGLNLDRATRSVIGAAQGTTIANNLNFRICYRVPFVHPMVTEPLRTRMLLPVHTYNQAPIITLDFEQAANMYSAGSLSQVSCEIVLLRRNMDAPTTAAIQKAGGFIPFDLLEVPLTVPLGYSGEIRLDLPTPGSYMNMLFRQYRGGGSITRDVVDQVTTFGAESPWRIESAGVVEHQWKWKDLQALGDFSGVLNSTVQASSPSFAGAVAAGTLFQPAASGMLDFFSDGLDSANELGSLLDANAPAKANLKVTLVGQVASVATNPSVIYFMGHKLYGDLTQWQALKTS